MICATVNLNTIIMLVGINKMNAKVCRWLIENNTNSFIISLLSSCYVELKTVVPSVAVNLVDITA